MTRVLVAILALAALLVGCPQPKSERELLIEAATLSQNGQVEEARAIFARLLEQQPPSHDVLIRYAGFLVDNGELEAAARALEQLASMELRGTDRSRLDTERRRYFERIYDGARGGAPAEPADRDAYEQGIIGLINIERTGPMLEEYNEYLIMQARAALGRSPQQAIPTPPDDVVEAASPEQIEAALQYLGWLLDGDPRCEVRREPEGLLASEAQALRSALLIERFEAGFEHLWSTRYRDAFIRDGRFDPASRTFRHHYVGPYREGYSLESGPDRLIHQARTWHAREVATDIAYELAGIERAGAEPLGYAVEDFATTTAAQPGEDELGNFVFDLAIPYDTILLGGWLLRQRIDAAAADAAASEGSGEAGEP